MKKVYALFLMTIMCVTFGVKAFVADNEEAEVLKIENAEFTYESMFTGENATYAFDYDESFLNSDAQNFNVELARASIGVSMSAASETPDNIKVLFEKLGFLEENNFIKYPKPTEDTVGYAVSSKKSGNKTLIICAVRGGGYGAEWADNFNVGTSGNHKGFDTQAKKLNTSINDYIAKKEIKKEDVKIWITGFSRGGATANIAAHSLSETYGNENVFAYCFECPQGVDKTKITTVDRNIFNIVNDIDFITYLAPSGWNLGRYGVTLYIPSEKTASDYEKLKKDMSLEYGNIYYAAQNSGKNPNWKIYYESPEMPGQAQLIDGIFASISKSMSRKDAETKLFEKLRETIAKYYETATVEVQVDNPMIECVTIIIKSIGFDALNLFVQTGMKLDEFTNSVQQLADSHYPELCLAWMNTVTGVEMFDECNGRLVIEKKVYGESYVDISAEDYFYEAVMWAAESGIDAGINDNEFAPDMNCSRAEIITLLWKVKGSPAPKIRRSPFSDVAEEDGFYEAVLWASENGIASGTSDTSFSPEETVTRGQAVTFLWRLENGGTYGQNPFSDVSENSYCKDAVVWAAENNITNGTTKTTFSPEITCTRGQIITFIYRWFGDKIKN